MFSSLNIIIFPPGTTDMSIEKSCENIKKLLKNHNQSYLLRFREQLDVVQSQNLLAQIEGLDFGKIHDWVAQVVKFFERFPRIWLSQAHFMAEFHKL